MERWNLASYFLDHGVWHHADVAVLERNGAIVLTAAAEPFHAQKLSGHEEARDLLASVVGDDDGLEEAAADGVEAAGLVARAEQRFIAPHSAACRDDVRHALEIFRGHTSGKARFPQIAARATDFARARAHGRCGLSQHDD